MAILAALRIAVIVIRRRVIEIRLMTEEAIRRRARVLTANVTFRTCGLNVRAGQREVRCIMIKRDVRPVCS